MENWPIINKKVFIFDLETSGLPSNPNVEILSISFFSSLFLENLQDNFYYYERKDPIFPIPQITIDINHLTLERLQKNGTPISDIFDIILPFISDSEYIISHNINFDKTILITELKRHNRNDILEILNTKTFLCSMEDTLHLTKLLPIRNNRYKYPKLSELYYFCFGQKLQETHNALDDVKNLTKCLYFIIYSKYNISLLNKNFNIEYIYNYDKHALTNIEYKITFKENINKETFIEFINNFKKSGKFSFSLMLKDEDKIRNSGKFEPDKLIDLKSINKEIIYFNIDVYFYS